MQRYFFIFLGISAIVVFHGCQSKVLRTLFEPQEWKNYALMEGVICTEPAMIDGDLKTVGHADGRWIHIYLPSIMPIHRIVIRGTNITDAMVYRKLQGDGRWQAILQIQNNGEPAIEMRMSTVTEALRIYVSGTADDSPTAGKYSPRYGAVVPQIKLGSAFAQEIEVYGFVSAGEKTSQTANEKRQN